MAFEGLIICGKKCFVIFAQKNFEKKVFNDSLGLVNDIFCIENGSVMVESLK